MYPDLGVVLFERSMDKPFRLTAFNGLTLATDRVLGWMINGLTRNISISPIQAYPAPIITEPMMFSIYLGSGSATRAEKIVEKLRTSGLAIILREDKKYLVPNGKEWVIPFQYLKNY